MPVNPPPPPRGFRPARRGVSAQQGAAPTATAPRPAAGEKPRPVQPHVDDEPYRLKPLPRPDNPKRRKMTLPHPDKLKMSTLTERFKRSTDPAPADRSDSPFEREVVDFDVPPVGGKPSAGKSQQVMYRLGIPVAALVAVAGTTFYLGVHTGSSRIPAQGMISQQEALKFRLSTFPSAQAATFAERYLQVCLTHPENSDTTAVRARLDLLAQMATGGTDPACGYSAGVSSSANAPTSVLYTGKYKSVKEGYNTGAAAFLTFQVTFSSDRIVEAVIPVWVDDTANPTAMRVVGNLGFMPVTSLGAPPAFSETRAKDATLASRLRDSVLAPFLKAWGSSDAQQLGLVLTDDASAAARTGLRGVLTDPTVNDVIVFTSRSSDGGQITYQDGDTVWAEVTAQWFSTVASAKQSATHQVKLRLVQGKWSVVDVAGSAIDPTGGPVSDSDLPATGKPKPTTTRPAAPSSTSPSSSSNPAAPTLPPSQN